MAAAAPLPRLPRGLPEAGSPAPAGPTGSHGRRDRMEDPAIALALGLTTGTSLVGAHRDAAEGGDLP
jgi:hypothetical protein